MSEELDALDDELLEAIARVKGHAVQKAVPQPVSKIYPLLAKEAARLKAEEEKRKRWEAALRNPKPGELMPDNTIYLGKYSPVDGDGDSLCREFNVFAAREDLPGAPKTYNDTVNFIASLKNWNGYDGANYADDAALYEALKKGAYDGKWIIPTMDILAGFNSLYKDTMPDNLIAHQNTGALKGTFNTSSGSELNYWSCTAEENRYDGNRCFNMNMRSTSMGWTRKDNHRNICRPVRLAEARLEPVP